MPSNVSEKGASQTYYPNYVTLGLLQMLGCAVLLFGFFVYFIETRSPPVEVRTILFRGFLSRLAETQFSILLMFAIFTALGRVRIDAEGIQGGDYYGLPISLTWDDMNQVQNQSVLGYKYIRVYPRVGQRFLSLPLSVFHQRRMIDAIQSLAPPENTLRQHLAD